MKKIFVFLVIILIAAPVFAQQRHFAITISPSPIIYAPILGGIGIVAGVEFAPLKNFAVKGNFYYVGWDFGKLIDEAGVDADISMLRFSVEGRFYPSGNYVEGFFLNGGFQFHRLGASFSYEGIKLSDGLNTYGVYGGAGYKLVFGRSRLGFVLEPTLDFIWPLKSDIPFKDMAAGSNLFGWILGVKMFRGGLKLGLAF
ncbi:MAG: hypothetical protein LBI12_08415 [Treponema sp.]|jgi:hypothetical protein|nr:hypothetical protein [Treponema sp.]